MKIKRIQKKLPTAPIVPKSFCIYTDTDSIFEPLEPIFVHRHGPMEDYTDEQIIERCKLIISDVQSFVNKSYDKYAKKFHCVDKHFWDIKQELISKRAFWVGKYNPKTKQFEGVKKRYAMWNVDAEGHAVDEMDVKGLDVVRSNFPQRFRSFMTELLEDILHDAKKDDLNEKVRQFKSVLEQVDMYQTMLPTGVKDIEKWETGVLGKRVKGTPAHVKAAMNYNDMLKMNNIIDVPPITDGEKVVWAYIRPNQYGFESMALKGFEDPDILVKFVSDHIDRTQIFERALKKKISNFWLSLGWGEIIMNDLSNKFFKF